MINSTILILTGILFGYFSGFNPATIPYFHQVINAFLLIVLFTNTQKINLKSLKKNGNKPLILVTIGLLFKIFGLGALLYLITGNIYSFLLAGVISQIDPVNTFSNVKKKLITKNIKDLVLFESSFDDPMTILLTFYLILPLTIGINNSIINYLFNLFINVCLALIVWLVLKLTKSNIVKKVLAVFSLIIAFFYDAFFFIAIAGLLIKNVFEKELSKLSTIIYYTIFPLMGMIICFSSFDVITGILIALILLLIVRPAEIIIFFRKNFDKNELLQLIFCEEKGITATLIALSLQSSINIAGIIIPAIILINTASNLVLRINSKSFNKKKLF